MRSIVRRPARSWRCPDIVDHVQQVIAVSLDGLQRGGKQLIAFAAGGLPPASRPHSRGWKFIGVRSSWLMFARGTTIFVSFARSASDRDCSVESLAPAVRRLASQPAYSSLPAWTHNAASRAAIARGVEHAVIQQRDHPGLGGRIFRRPAATLSPRMLRSIVVSRSCRSVTAPCSTKFNPMLSSSSETRSGMKQAITFSARKQNSEGPTEFTATPNALDAHPPSKYSCRRATAQAMPPTE